MKLSKCLSLVALLLSAASHAQTSQTFYFGEGQGAPQRGRATSSPPLAGAEPSRRQQHHHHHTTRHSPHQNQYSRP
jgi:hypothetical protein